MNLKEHFEKYVGRLVKKNHNILSDPLAQEIAREAKKYGLTPFFEAQGRQNSMLPENEKLLRVALVDDGVPAGKQGWGWRIAQITIG